MTDTTKIYLFGSALFLFVVTSHAQTADSLHRVRSVYVGSLGANDGANELRRELAELLKHSRRLQSAASPQQADIVLEGRGELWIRGYRSLSPRARVNSAATEPSYGGFLSVKAVGRDGEVLWSHLANPKPVSFTGVERQLASQVLDRLADDIDRDTTPGAPPAATPASTDGPTITLHGAGATFPFPLYQDWFRSFHAKHRKWEFEYAPAGSEAGIERLIAKTVEFAGSDIPLTGSPALQSSKSVQAFATVAGAVALIYNLPRFGGELRLNDTLIAQILSGKVKTWNDPAIRALNRSLPAMPITVIHRSEGSGTNFALTDYLSKVDAEWKRTVGPGARVRWPVGLEASGNEGVAKLVGETPGAIGYVEFTYAFYHHLGVASVSNAAGHFLQPDLSTIAAAATSTDVSITNSSAPNAYPISTFSWIVFERDMDAAKRAGLLEFLEWAMSSGQKQCSALGYVPLPRAVLDQQFAALRKSRID